MMQPPSPKTSPLIAGVLAVAGTCLAAAGDASAKAPTLPEIRMSAAHLVPACVTPSRLMRHVLERNGNLEARFRDIARHYKAHGEALGIRWDYAFFQMLLETNYLSFRRGNGEWGDVRPSQNNFAGIGATGGGVPGDSFPDVSSGVLAQMQHLVAYSGERVERPIAPRTREKQDDIILKSRALGHSVRFSDLTRRWAADRNYATSIEAVAERYRQAFCSGAADTYAATDGGADANPGRAPATMAGGRTLDALPRAPAPTEVACDVLSASYGGSVALLIRSVAGGMVNYTVLQVEADLEQPQVDAYLRAHAPNGRAIARFTSREQALARAFSLCPRPS